MESGIYDQFNAGNHFDLRNVYLRQNIRLLVLTSQLWACGPNSSRQLCLSCLGLVVARAAHARNLKKSPCVRGKPSVSLPKKMLSRKQRTCQVPSSQRMMLRPGQKGGLTTLHHKSGPRRFLQLQIERVSTDKTPWFFPNWHPDRLQSL